jgi:lysophospholipase
MNKNHFKIPCYTQESRFEQVINSTISDFWEKRESGKQASFDGTPLYWCQLTSPKHSKAIMIVNGRIESVYKYRELFFDLFQLGYDVYSYDHRGQGLSERLILDSDVGHIEQFEDYVNDLGNIIDFFNLNHYSKRYLVAHSMGGAIALRYLQQKEKSPFDAIALTSPMLGLPIPYYLHPIARPYTYWLTKKSQIPTYAPGYGPYYEKPFEDNPLTHSSVRYTWFRALYQSNAQLQVGGPSSRWVWQSLLTLKQIYHDAKKIQLPLLILQAGNDHIVDNKAQLKFILRVQKTNLNTKLKIINGANHELLFEKDEYRNRVLQSITHFLEQY